MPEEIQMRRRRAAYRASHRGTKEMDIILGRYAEAHLGAMSEAELGTFERFLALPDPVLNHWFAQGEAPVDAAEFAPLVAALRAHHGLAASTGARPLERQ